MRKNDIDKDYPEKKRDRKYKSLVRVGTSIIDIADMTSCSFRPDGRYVTADITFGNGVKISVGISDRNELARLVMQMEPFFDDRHIALPSICEYIDEIESCCPASGKRKNKKKELPS